jgi:hypothetical protein
MATPSVFAKVAFTHRFAFPIDKNSTAQTANNKIL